MLLGCVHKQRALNIVTITDYLLLSAYRAQSLEYILASG